MSFKVAPILSENWICIDTLHCHTVRQNKNHMIASTQKHVLFALFQLFILEIVSSKYTFYNYMQYFFYTSENLWLFLMRRKLIRKFSSFFIHLELILELNNLFFLHKVHKRLLNLIHMDTQWNRQPRRKLACQSSIWTHGLTNNPRITIQTIPV